MSRLFLYLPFARGQVLEEGAGRPVDWLAWLVGYVAGGSAAIVHSRIENEQFPRPLENADSLRQKTTEALDQ